CWTVAVTCPRKFLAFLKVLGFEIQIWIRGGAVESSLQELWLHAPSCGQIRPLCSGLLGRCQEGPRYFRKETERLRWQT
ncbi:Hypothetical predicted protein, partial [Prunus dulcis]